MSTSTTTSAAMTVHDMTTTDEIARYDARICEEIARHGAWTLRAEELARSAERMRARGAGPSVPVVMDEVAARAARMAGHTAATIRATIAARRELVQTLPFGDRLDLSGRWDEEAHRFADL